MTQPQVSSRQLCFWYYVNTEGIISSLRRNLHALEGHLPRVLLVCMGIQEAPRTFSESLTCFSKRPPAEAAVCAWRQGMWVEMAKGISQSRAGLGTGGK